MRLFVPSATYRLPATVARLVGKWKVAALPTPSALPEAVPPALPPPASVDTWPVAASTARMTLL